jgi:hypothetical protein
MSKHKPFTPQGTMRKCNFTLKFLGEGSYREVYHIVGTNWVIKFPLTEWDPAEFSPLVNWLLKHRMHSRNEIDTYLEIKEKKKFKVLRKYLPKILWWEWHTGVIIQELCKELEGNVSNDILSRDLCLLFKKYFKDPTDIVVNNVGRDLKGKLKVIDMGLIGEE